jgi:hypothetical protein
MRQEEISITIGQKKLKAVLTQWAEGSGLIIADQHPQTQHRAAKIGRVLFWDRRNGLQRFRPEQAGK